jgi:hypothetical protein
MKLKKKKFDLLASIGLILLILINGVPKADVYGQVIDWGGMTPYAIYIILAFTLRRYFYSDN